MNCRIGVMLLTLALAGTFTLVGTLGGTVKGVQFRILPSDRHATGEIVVLPLLPVYFRALHLRGESLDPLSRPTVSCSASVEWLPGDFRVPRELGANAEGHLAITVLQCGKAVYGLTGVDFSR